MKLCLRQYTTIALFLLMIETVYAGDQVSDLMARHGLTEEVNTFNIKNIWRRRSGPINFSLKGSQLTIIFVPLKAAATNRYQGLWWLPPELEGLAGIETQDVTLDTKKPLAATAPRYICLVKIKPQGAIHFEEVECLR